MHSKAQVVKLINYSNISNKEYQKSSHQQLFTTFYLIWVAMIGVIIQLGGIVIGNQPIMDSNAP